MRGKWALPSPRCPSGVSICQCDALSGGTNSITQHPASLSLSASPPSSHPGPMHQAHTPQQPPGMGAQHMGPRSAAHDTGRPSQTNELGKQGRTGSSCQPSRSRSPAALCSHTTHPRTLPWRELTQSALALFKCAGLTAVTAPRAGGAFLPGASVPLSEVHTLPKKADILHFFKVSGSHSGSRFVEANLARPTWNFHFADFQVGFIYLDVTCKDVIWQLLISPLLPFIILLCEQSRVSLPRCLLEHQAWFHAAFGYLTEINVIYILIPAYQQIK